MNILITGGRGFIGTALSRELRSAGHRVIVTTRHRHISKDEITWQPPSLIYREVISEIDAVINLAGESLIAGRWSKKRKERIMSSRLNTTHALVESMKQIPLKPPFPKGETADIPLFGKEGLGSRCREELQREVEIFKKAPKVLISASAVGYYGPHGDEFVTEDTPPASDFLAEVCRTWEAEALKAGELGTRVVITRFGVVLGAHGGALEKMAPPFRLFLGGPIGSGRQWFSWIHMNDLIGIVKFALEHEALSGAVNAVSPQPVTNRDFSAALGSALHRPSWFAVPETVVKAVFGEVGRVLLTGQRVLPQRVLEAGYKFRYSGIKEALRAIYS